MRGGRQRLVAVTERIVEKQGTYAFFAQLNMIADVI